MTLAIVSTTWLLALSVPALAQTEAQVYKPGNGVVAPKVLHEVKPSYPAEAMKSGVGGTVQLECVVRADGTVGDVRVVRPLEPSLDAEATRAIKEWRFSPGLKDGQPVPVLVEVEMSFTTLRGPRLDSPDVYKASQGVTLPKLVHETRPVYTAEARRAGIQGTVVLDCVVLTDGTVGDVRVRGRLDPDLDAEGIRTIRQWRFTPGTKDGQAVPVQVSIELTFSLR